VLHGWHLWPGRPSNDDLPPPPEQFHRLTRDLYVPSADIGFWQTAMREPHDPLRAAVSEAVAQRAPLTIDILYGDHDGGQRTITRFALVPRDPADGDPSLWSCAVGRHWNLDRDDPR
jgi:hypothetical protein